MDPNRRPSLVTLTIRTVPWLVLGALGVWLILLGALRARLDVLLGCPDIPSQGEVPAPRFCVDITSVPYDMRTLIRGKINDYADGLVTLDATGDPRTPLTQLGGKVSASIAPVAGAKKLSKADLARRGRIVAKIYSSGSYAHGIAPGYNYVWADYGPFRKWRVLIIPADPYYPISVLSDTKVDEPGPRGGSANAGGAIQLYDSPEEWRLHLSQEAAACDYAQKGACWIFTGSGSKQPQSATADSPQVGSRAGTIFGTPTDGWVFVTGSGCVCVGNKCHT